LSRVKELIQTLATILPPAAQSRVKYHWRRYNQVPQLEAIMFLIRSEFSCLHEYNFDDTAKELISNLSRELVGSDIYVIEACISGISNIICNLILI
jgi:hypothetical protein